MTETECAEAALTAFIDNGFPAFGEIGERTLPAKAFALALLRPLSTDDATLSPASREALLRHVEYYDNDSPPAIPYRVAATVVWLWLDGQSSQVVTEIDSLRTFSMTPVQAGEEYPLI